MFLKSFAVSDVKKELPIEQFLQQFSIRNSKNIKIKKSIVTLLHNAQKLKLIQPLTKSNQLKKIEKLNSNLVSKAKSIFYSEIIDLD